MNNVPIFNLNFFFFWPRLSKYLWPLDANLNFLITNSNNNIAS